MTETSASLPLRKFVNRSNRLLRFLRLMEDGKPVPRFIISKEIDLIRLALDECDAAFGDREKADATR